MTDVQAEPWAGWRVQLAPYEVVLAAGGGLRRQLSGMSRPDAHGYNRDAGWQDHIEGACGELVVAKYLGIFWTGSVDTFRSKADLGADVEVRTRSRHDYDLMIRRGDDMAKRYVLVTGQAPNYWLRGYAYGWEAERDEWWQQYGGRPGAWFMPAAELHPIPQG